MTYQAFIFCGTLGCLLTLCALWIAVETDAGYRWLDKE